MGGIAVPCHPGRPDLGYTSTISGKPALENIVAVELLNGGSRKGEDDRATEWCANYGYQAPAGGSDSHLVSLIGLCATRFEADVSSIDDLVRELKTGQITRRSTSAPSANPCRMRFRPKRGRGKH